MNFRTVVELNGKTATGIEVPDEVVAELGSGKRPAVKVVIGGYSYRSTVASMGGRFLLPVSAEVRQHAGVAAGDEVDVEIELDTEPRVVTVPPDLASALDQDGAARQTFDAMSYSHQRAYVEWIEQAKAPETRQRRLDKTVTELHTGKPKR